jgi:hypothetical protein
LVHATGVYSLRLFFQPGREMVTMDEIACLSRDALGKVTPDDNDGLDLSVAMRKSSQVAIKKSPLVAK